MAPKLRKVIRLDSIPLSKAFFTPEGYLKDNPVVTSVGIFEYGNPDGSIRRELRLPEDVFEPESLASYKGKPIIITHDAGLVTKDNVQDYQIGTILSNGYRDHDDVKAEIIIHNTDEMKDCGLKELSLGYNLELDETPGVWNGQKYDAIQRNIRINHLALVREARAGEQARLNIDGRDSDDVLKGGKAMKRRKTISRKAPRKAMRRTRRHDGVMSAEELAKAIEEYKRRRQERLAADEDEEVVESPVPEEEVAEDDDEIVAAPAEPKPSDDAEVEEKVQFVKDRRSRRDAEGDPEELEEAEGIIANQDEDIDILFDIIDTLLAEKEFDEAEEETQAETETLAPEEDVVAEDEDEDTPEEDVLEEELAEDDDEELAEENISEETIPEDELVEDEDEDVIPYKNENEIVNTDSVDRIVRDRINLGIVGSILHMDGLETMKMSKAKRRVIKMVRPGLRLDGKSRSYINAAFDCACEDIKRKAKKDTSYQKKQMFNRDSRSRSKRVDSADAARNRMIARRNKKHN